MRGSLACVPRVGRGRVATRGSIRHRAARILAPLSVWSASACGSPNPKVLAQDEIAPTMPTREHQDMSEADKIRRLIEEVRKSDATFLVGEKELDGNAAATDLEHRVPRMGVATARQFVETLTHPTKDGAGPRVRLKDGTVLDGRDWFLARIAAIEGGSKPAHATRVQTDPNVPVTLGILDALTIVERSNKRFVAPARTLPNGKTKGKRKEYDAGEFAEMLRKKWEFLGADVKDLEHFINEIATDAFSSMEPYRVIHEDGSEEEFRAWLLAQLELRRVAIAKGGAP
jgi:hypothetical protein